jgi:hypothetical protein
VILGECKDQCPIKPEEFETDIDVLKRVAAMNSFNPGPMGGNGFASEIAGCW